MDFKINRETVTSSECIYEGIQEQSLEMDYILPDYYPDIFKLIRCEVIPTVSDCVVNGDKINYELKCDIRILYCAENSSVVQCVYQRKKFSRTAEIGKIGDNPTAFVSAKAEHMNYRAVNKRRLELRGAVSIKLRAEAERSQEIICDAFGLNVQLKKTPVCFASKKLKAEKLIQLSEDTEISSSQPAVISIISCRCRASECEKKIISGKLLAKGEICINLLYSCEKDGEGALEPLEFSVPYSQIVDVEGLDDSFECSVKAIVSGCETTVGADKNGENRILKCELDVILSCTAMKTASIAVGTDAYSTTHPCSIETAEIQTEQIPIIYTRKFKKSVSITQNDEFPQTVYSMWCRTDNINTRTNDDGKSVSVSGMLTFVCAGKTGGGLIVMPEKDCTFEESAELDSVPKNSVITAEAEVTDVSYNISSDSSLTAEAEILLKIMVRSSSGITAVTDISVDDSVKKERDGDYAIKLYYGVEDEEVWNIAKRYSTSVSAVMEENDISGERLESCGMLLIPIVY